MRFALSLMISFLLGLPALGNSIDPSSVELPWKNGPTRDAVYKFSDYPNTVHVIEAYANFCGPCNTNAPKVKDLAEEYENDDRVQVIDLSLDTSELEIQRWIARHNPVHPVLKDEGRQVWEALMQTNGIPQTFIVDCAGTLVDYTLGVWDTNAIINRIRDAVETAKLTVCE